MSPGDHTKKVTGEETEKKAASPFRCDNCGSTFVSESERKTHEQSHEKAGKAKPAE